MEGGILDYLANAFNSIKSVFTGFNPDDYNTMKVSLPEITVTAKKPDKIDEAAVAQLAEMNMQCATPFDVLIDATTAGLKGVEHLTN
mgnify:CR=1 FL=1